MLKKCTNNICTRIRNARNIFRTHKYQMVYSDMVLLFSHIPFHLFFLRERGEVGGNEFFTVLRIFARNKSRGESNQSSILR